MITKEQHLFIDRTIKVMAWRTDVEIGELIEQRRDGEQYCKDHLSVKGGISQGDLETICDVVNDAFLKSGCDLMVSNSMGEFTPARRE